MIPYCLVLDLDDTLFLERDYVASGFRAVANWVRQRFGNTDFAGKAYGSFLLGRRGDIFDAALRDCGHEGTPADIQTMINIYRTHTPAISLSPDAAEFLDYFRGKAHLALITDGSFASQRRKFRALRLQPVFEHAVFTDLFGRAFWKPHLRAFQHIQQKVGAGNLSYIYIGDNPNKDFDAPAALHWGSVRVRRAGGIYSQDEPNSAVKPSIEIADLRALIPLIRSGECLAKYPQRSRHNPLHHQTAFYATAPYSKYRSQLS